MKIPTTAIPTAGNDTAGIDTAGIHTTMGLREWGLLLTLTLLWGPTFYFTEIALTGMPPLTVVMLRLVIAALMMQTVLRGSGQAGALGRESWLAFLGMGLLNNALPFSLIVWGQQHITGGLAAILNATTPISTVIIAHLLTHDEKLTRNRLLGVLVGCAGVIVMVGPAALGGVGGQGWPLLGQLAVLGASLSYALASIYGRRFRRRGITAVAAATGQLTASALLMVPMALMVERPWLLPMPPWPVWLAVALLGLFSTPGGYVVYFRILSSAGATNLMLVTLLMPVIAILLGGTLLGEVLEPSHFAGMGLIALGLAAIDGRLISICKRKMYSLRKSS